ncbi:MAG: hypothetical protein FWC43_02375 [Planctomycetaceae bacterium]|nr:hypothetical protein [Planctomycetaceae bacterium]
MKFAKITGTVLATVLALAGIAKYVGGTLNIDGARRTLRNFGILVSEIEESIRSVENDISTLKSIERSSGSNLWKLDSQIRRNAETRSQTEEEIIAKERSLNDLDLRLKEGKPLFDRFSKKEMTPEEIDAYITKCGIELKALRDLLAELCRQDELLGAQVAKIRQESVAVPIRILELTKGLELLKLQYAFNKQYYADMKQNGCPVDAEAIYRQAKNTLASTLSDLGCGTSTPMPEPDLGPATSTANRCEQQRAKISALLGRADTEPIMMK